MVVKRGRECRYKKVRERVKNLAKDTGVKYSDLCTHACPYHLAGSALPSVFGGSEQLRKKEFVVF